MKRKKVIAMLVATVFTISSIPVPVSAVDTDLVVGDVESLTGNVTFSEWDDFSTETSDVQENDPASTEFSDFEQDEESVNVLSEEETYQKLQMNVDQKIIISDSEEAVIYAFTPMEDGEYQFLAVPDEKEQLPKVEVFTSEGEKQNALEEKICDEGSEEIKHISVYSLKAGITYHIHFSLEKSDETGGYLLRVSRQEETDLSDSNIIGREDIISDDAEIDDSEDLLETVALDQEEELDTEDAYLEETSSLSVSDTDQQDLEEADLVSAAETVQAAETITITKEPQNAEVKRNTSAGFSVAATGSDLTYLWQYKLAGSSDWVDWSSKKSTSMTVAYAKNRDGMTLRCQIKDSEGHTAYSAEALLTYLDVFEIVTDPKDADVETGETAVFSVLASGSGMKYLWQYQYAGETDWTDWTSKRTSEITVAYLKQRDQMNVRCRVTDENNKVIYSNPATLRYWKQNPDAIRITKQPKNAMVPTKETAAFAVTAEGTDLKYLWQYQYAGSSEWIDWTTKTKPSMTVAYAKSRDGMLLRCKITDGEQNLVYSDPVTLTYSDTFEITEQPENVSIEAGKTATFAVSACGSGMKYLWQYRYVGESDWTNWTSKKTSEITVAYAGQRNGMELRCAVTDGNGVTIYSEAATLKYLTTIIKQPEDSTVALKETANFAVSAIGAGLKYLWQYRYAGENAWTDWTSKKTAEITVAYGKMRHNMSLRCAITDSAGETTYSDEAVLRYGITITVQPEDVTIEENKTAIFSVTATGIDLKYLWQYKLAGSTDWVDWTSKRTPEITVAYLKSRDGMSVRCKITDSSGQETYSDEAVLTYDQEKETVINGVHYAVVDGKMTVTGYDGTDASVTVEETVNGAKVTIVGEEAFYKNKTITHVDLPDTIEVIGKRAFAECSNLNSMD